MGRLLATLLLAIPLLVGAFVAPAQAARNMEIGLQDDGLLLNPFARAAALQSARQLGVTTLRVNLRWSTTLHGQARRKRKPRRVRYDFSAYDALIADAAAYGMRVQLTLWGPSPRWATLNHRVSLYAPRPRAFARFAGIAAAHFRGRVRRYSIWNEPNWHSFLRPHRRAARLYRGLYQAGWRAIKRVDPSAQVLIGELSRRGLPRRSIAPLRFMRAVLCVDRHYHKRRGCRGLLTDGFAQHVYNFSKPPGYKKGLPADEVSIGTIGRLAHALKRLRRARALSTPRGGIPYIYATEFGYFASGRRAERPRTRARWTVQGFALARAHPRVRQLVYYMLIRRRGIGWDTGLMPASGPGLVFNALARWTAAQRATGRLAPRSAPLHFATP